MQGRVQKLKQIAVVSRQVVSPWGVLWVPYGVLRLGRTVKFFPVRVRPR